MKETTSIVRDCGVCDVLRRASRGDRAIEDAFFRAIGGKSAWAFDLTRWALDQGFKPEQFFHAHFVTKSDALRLQEFFERVAVTLTEESKT